MRGGSLRAFVMTVALVAMATGCRAKTVVGSGDPEAELPDDADTADAATPQGDAGAGDARGDAAPAEAPFAPAASNTTVSLRAAWISADDSLAVAVGDAGTILLSTDGGATWTTSQSGVTTMLAGVWGSGPNDVWVVGDDETILRSTTGGASWDTLSLDNGPTKPNLRSVFGTSADQVFVGAASGTVYRTRDKGVTFYAKASGAITALNGFGAVSTDDIWTASDHDLFRSTNGGDSYSPTGSSLNAQTGMWVGGIDDVYTVNDAGIVTRYDTTKNVLYKNDVGAFALHGITGTSAADVWVVGGGGKILHSTDRSASWRAAPTPAGTPDLHAVAASAKLVVAVGDAGAIVRR